MNWPPLTDECSKAIEEVLRDVVKNRPKDPFKYVAELLQERSGLDSAEFEGQFEQCRRARRTYLLEDRCPQGQDPMSWVVMRYNDDTILRMLKQRMKELILDICDDELIEDTEGLIFRIGAAFPELSYLKGSPEEMLASQVVRAVYLGFSGCEQVVEKGLDDESAQLCFRCELLVEFVRSQCLQPLSDHDTTTDAMIVCCLLRVLGRHAGFQSRFGGGLTSPDQALLHAIQNYPEAVPSFRRLDEPYQQLVLATLQVAVPVDMIVSTEAAPAHFDQVKEKLVPKEGGMLFFLSAINVDHLVKCRNTHVSADTIDLLRLSMQSLGTVEKTSAARAYEMLLKKRAERHGWRLVRDDYIHRAIIRLCCMSGQEEKELWGNLLVAVEDMSDQEQAILKMELGCKDGIVEAPAFILEGGSRLLWGLRVKQSEVPSAIHLLASVLEDASRSFEQMPSHKVVRLDLDNLVTRALEVADANGRIKDIPYLLEEKGPGEMTVRAR